MKTHTSKRVIWSKGLLLLPLLALLLYSFSSSEVIEKEVPNTYPESLETPASKKVIFQDIATKKMVKEYNALAKRYNDTNPGELMVKNEEMKRMRYIYDLMTPKQRSNAESFPKMIPPPARAPEAPHAPNTPHVAHPAEGALPPAPHVEIEIFEMNGDSVIMPPPPPVPTEHMKELAAEGAEFYLEGKKISTEEAIKLVESKKSLNIDVRKKVGSKPVVKLSTKGVNK